MKQVVQDIRKGDTSVVEVPVPAVRRGMVLVRNAASLVSAGTERSLIEFTSKSMVGKALSRPDLVRRVLNKAQREGILSTFDAVRNRMDQPMPLGYSSAGVVVEPGEGIAGFRAGDRVACAGGGYAVHAEYVLVPVNLVAALPDDVSFEAGAFGTLGAIALHGFRLAEPTLGESVAVIGLGVLGMLAAQVAQAAGCRVLGIDTDPARVAFAKQIGIDAVARGDAVDSGASYTRGYGFDIVQICADTPGKGGGHRGCGHEHPSRRVL
jgi:threonine dehydrogenase-like Zn-dependent dehydrogenase